MKKIILSFALIFTVLSALPAQLTATERKTISAELIKSQSAVMTSIQGLNKMQLNYKSSPDSWSIAECVEYLAVAETNFSMMLQGAVKTPADASKRSEVSMTDEKLIAFIKDRSTKVKTLEPFEPSGKLAPIKRL